MAFDDWHGTGDGVGYAANDDWTFFCASKCNHKLFLVPDAVVFAMTRALERNMQQQSAANNDEQQLVYSCYLS